MLKKIHAYAGLVLGLFLAVYAITGGALIFKDGIWRLQYPDLHEPLAVLTADDHAAAFTRATELFPEGVTSIKVPREGMPAYHLYTASGELLLNQNNYAVIDSWRWYETTTGILTELHFHLGAGKTGKKLGGYVALLCCVMGITGIIVWWPVRRSFKIDRIVAKTTKRGELIRMHRDLGAIAVLSLVLFSITAAGVIFYPMARLALNGLLSNSEPTVLSVFGPPLESVPAMPTPGQIRASLQALPDARLIAYYPPSQKRALHYFRFKHPAEPHPNGRSAVYIYVDSESVAQVVDATRQPVGEKSAQLLYPLHAAKIGGHFYALFSLFSAIAIAVIALTGPIAYLRRKPQDPRQKPDLPVS